MTWSSVLLGTLTGLLLFYALLLGLLWRSSRRTGNSDLLREALRLLPDLLRLLKNLAADPALPRGVRIRLGLLLLYLANPIDLIPDFIPVLGYADDMIIVAVALRSVIRHAGIEALDRHWTGSPAGRQAVHRLAGAA